MKKRLTVSILALTMIMSSAVGVMAAPTDFVHTESGDSYSLLQAASSKSIVLKLASSPSAHKVLDSNGKAYNLKEVLDLIESGLTYDEALVEANPIEEDAEELEVIDISAIDATNITVVLSDETTHHLILEEALEANVATEVTFEIDGKEYTATVTWEQEIEEELTVESVSAINKTGVTVNITKLTEDLEGQTIEVKDNNGNVVEVKPLNLVVNETEATFVFKTALTANPTGVWTIAGMEFDADVYAKVDAINKANTELKLYNALTAAGIQNLKVENSAAYNSADKPADGFKTLAEVQSFVDKVNAEQATGEEKEEQVKELVKALANGSQVLVLNALTPFERVNEDFITKYVDDMKIGGTDAITDTTAFKTVQTQLDAVNVTEVTTLVGTAKTNAKRADYNKAVAAMNFVREDDPKVTSDKVKANLQKDLDLLNLVLNVKEASTAAQFANAYNALVAHVNNKTTIGTEVFYTDLRTNYMAATKVIDGAETVKDAADIEAAIVAANTVKRAELFNDVANVVDTAGSTQTSTANVLKALQALAAYSDKADFDIKTVETTTARLEAYRPGLAALTAIATPATETAANVKTAIQSVQTVITTANSTAVGTPLSDIVALSTPSDDDLLDALNDAELGLKNVVDANVDAYQADLVAIQGAATVGVSPDTAAKAIARLNVVIKDINLLVDINKATTAEEVHTALLALSGNDDYINVPSADRIWVATKVLAARNLETGKVFADLDAVMAASTGELAVAAGLHTAALTAVNNLTAASTITDVIDALAAIDADFAELSAAEQADIAEAFFLGLEFSETTNKVSPAFRTLEAVKAAAGL